MPSPTSRPDNRALYETAGAERRAILCCQVNPNESGALDEIRQAATDWRMRVLKLMPAIYHLSLTGPLASQLMRTARELGLLVNIHSGSEISHPLAIGALARGSPMSALSWITWAIANGSMTPLRWRATTPMCTWARPSRRS